MLFSQGTGVLDATAEKAQRGRIDTGQVLTSIKANLTDKAKFLPCPAGYSRGIVQLLLSVDMYDDGGGGRHADERRVVVAGKKKLVCNVRHVY